MNMGLIKQKLKVLYVGGFELPDLNAAAHRVRANGKILNHLGYNVVYIGVSNKNDCNCDVFTTRKVTNYGIDYKIKYPDNIISWFNFLTKVSDIIRIIELENITTIIAYNYPAPTLFKLYEYCNKNNIKIISDCTEWSVSKGNIVFQIIKGLDTFFRMKVIQPKLDGIIVISKFLYDFYSGKNNNVILVPPLVDLEDSKWNQVKLKENIGCHFVYGGSPFGKMKDHLGKLISAFSIVKQKFNKNFILNILGITVEEYNKMWKETPIPSFLNESIKFHGRVSNIEVIKKLKEADFSIFIREENLVTKAGFPTKFVEAISAGTPVLSNKNSNIADYLEDGFNGFFLDTSSVKSLAESLSVIMNCSKNKMEEMKLNCKRYNKFVYLEYINEFSDLLEKAGENNKINVNVHGYK